MNGDNQEHNFVDPTLEEGERKLQAMRFAYLKELIIFIFGVFLGFFWRLYSEAMNENVEADIIIGLIVVIICMSRYIVLSRR